jgi:hypothetical protein
VLEFVLYGAADPGGHRAVLGFSSATNLLQTLLHVELGE